MLWDLYVAQRQTASQIAKRLGCTDRAVFRRLKDAGIAPRGRQLNLDRAQLVRVYVDEGLTALEVSRRLGVDQRTVAKYLDENGIARHQLPVAPEVLRHLYLEECLSITEIASRVGRSPQAIGHMLHRHGIMRRPVKPGAERIAKSTLVALYVSEGMSATAVAHRLGCSKATVTRALRLHGIDQHSTRRFSASEEQVVVRLCVEERLSPEEAAAKLGCDRQTVERLLDRRGVAWRGARVRRLPADLGAEQLRELYVDRRLTHAEIAAPLRRNRVSGATPVAAAGRTPAGDAVTAVASCRGAAGVV